jgi:hypothetical protein
MSGKFFEKKGYKSLIRYIPTVCLLLASMSAVGEVTVEETVKVRAGTVTLLKQITKDVANGINFYETKFILKLEKKVITQINGMEFANINGHYVTGDYDVIPLRSSMGGNAVEAPAENWIYLIDAKGNVTKARIKYMNGQEYDSLQCDWHPLDKTNPIQKEGKLIFQCTELDYKSRRTLTSYFTLDKNVMTESRQSKLWTKSK